MYVSTYVLLAMCVCVMCLCVYVCVCVCLCVSALLNPFSYYNNDDYNDDNDRAVHNFFCKGGQPGGKLFNSLCLHAQALSVLGP